MRNTSKPIWTLPYQRADVLDILDLLWIIAGSRQAFEDKPFFVCASVPAAPLYGTEQNIEILLTCAEAGVPVVTYSCPAIGGNSPCDMVGAMVLANADWLANVVMHQLKRPGAPICTAGFTVQVMDMSTTLWSYSAPEAVTAYAAVADLAHWYGMPAWGLEMCTDSPRLDAQAGVEMMAECFRAMSSGVNMVHNAGLVGAGKLCAAEGVILADEIISYTRAMMQPPHVNAANLAENVALINEVGPMGEYVSHAHTLQQFRNVWYPTLFDRAMFDPQQVDGRTQLLDRLNSRARHLIETAEPFPLPDDVLREMDALEISWLSRVVVQ